ncbi:MAG: hypothetical protein ACKPGT_30210, partial [Microcystis sp.]
KYFYSSFWRGTAYVTVEGAECGFITKINTRKPEEPTPKSSSQKSCSLALTAILNGLSSG